MKKKILIVTLLLTAIISDSCKKNILDASDPGKLNENGFFTKVSDATEALLGVYVAAREMFYKTYAWDGASDMMFSRISARPYSNYIPGNTFGSSVSRHWSDGYRVINRANYLLVHLKDMQATLTGAADQAEMKRIEGEAILLRSMAYFRLIDLWGDVPYYENILNGNDEAYSLTRTPKATIKDKILADLLRVETYVPITIAKADQGRATRAAIFAYKGKIELYWACWAKTAGNAAEATTYYTQAAADLAEVMKPAYGRSLYRAGDPGTATAPAYGEMFDGDQGHEDGMYQTEAIFAFTNGGPTFGASDGQSDEFYGDTYLYDFGCRSTGAGGTNVAPEMRLVNRYQLLATGDFAPPVIPMNPTTVPTAKTALNSAVNPASYVGRDYRMFATVMWDGQQQYEILADGTMTSNLLTYLYKTTAPTPPYLFTDGSVVGYIYRKFVRQNNLTGFAREAGPQDSWMMRLPDVWLMYAEAVNEISGPTPETYDLIDKIRHRGNLPPLVRANFASKTTFFNAIEQERIIELAAEGSRFFDIRRWHKVEQIFPQPGGSPVLDTWGVLQRDEFKNAIDRDFQRFYQFQIPTGEIQNNPRLTQNPAWL